MIIFIYIYMNRKILTSFIIGTSIIVLFLFYIGVIYNKNKTYSFELYVFLAPLYFGLMNAISKYIANKYNINERKRLLITSIISAILISTLATLKPAYNYNQKEWIRYYIYIFIKHLFIYNIIIYYLEKKINKN